MNQKSTLTTIKTFIILVLITLVAIGCNSDDDNGNTNGLEVAGTIQVQGITTYQYGTHVISDFAIRSSTINLDDFINQSVTVVGTKIDGYPVDGGPDYLEVVEVKE